MENLPDTHLARLKVTYQLGVARHPRAEMPDEQVVVGAILEEVSVHCVGGGLC